MNFFDVVAILITLSPLFGYINYRFIKLPTAIGLMLISILMSLGMVILGHSGDIGLGIEQKWINIIKNIDFNKTLMLGMLSFLLFAGALHVDLNELMKQKWAYLRDDGNNSFDLSCRSFNISHFRIFRVQSEIHLLPAVWLNDFSYRSHFCTRNTQ